MTVARDTGRDPGTVFTRPWVVRMILDLAGYREEEDLPGGTAIEPAIGGGAFLVVMAERLVRSAVHRGVAPAALEGCIRGFDVDEDAIDVSRTAVAQTLLREGVDPATVTHLTRAWVLQADFLDIAPTLRQVRWVVGNPPFVRIEDLDPDALARYRTMWTTMRGRADLYVGFLEAALHLLQPGGSLSVICADRWMRNQYGASLRKLIADGYNMSACIEFQEVDAFEDKVAAYPAIVHIRREPQGSVLVSETLPGFAEADASELVNLAAGIQRSERPGCQHLTARLDTWFTGESSWPTGSPDELRWLARAQASLGSLADSGVRVATGIATGADAAFLVEDPQGIEADRLIPAVAANEVSSGQVRWRGRHLVNPWTEDGSLAHLEDYPGMAQHLRGHAARIKGRHVAQKNPKTWWRTIDRVPAGLQTRHKLLIPDLKDRVFPVLDEGNYLPLHSLAYITSETWDLNVLGALLMSSPANRFIRAFSVRMANGYRRASSQYLRRILLPDPTTLDDATRSGLAGAFQQRDLAVIDAICEPLFECSLTSAGRSQGECRVPRV